MIVLGIETSTAVCSVGFANETGLSVERSLIESHIHSEKLLTLTQELCEDQRIALSKIDGIAISLGPGSFTGLRIGLSTAKGLCYALGKPLIGVPAFEAVAKAVFGSHPQCGRVVVCVDAKQGDYYFSAYEKTQDTFQAIVPVQIGNCSAALFAVTPKTVIVTDRMDVLKNDTQQAGVIENILPYCRGDVVAQIALKNLKEGEKNRPEDLEPMYLKDFIIRTQVK
jgi:tRNA threonylcarbamoyladenosine biosynthesis protein TsaB